MNITIRVSFEEGMVSYEDTDEFPSALNPDEHLIALWPIYQFQLMFPTAAFPTDIETCNYEPQMGNYHILRKIDGVYQVEALDDPSDHPTTAWFASNAVAIKAEAIIVRMAELEPA